MFGRKKRAIAAQVPAIVAEEILRLLIAKGTIDRGDAAACLRGIANHVVAYGQLSGLGAVGRPYAESLVAKADEFARRPDRPAADPVRPFIPAVVRGDPAADVDADETPLRTRSTLRIAS